MVSDTLSIYPSASTYEFGQFTHTLYGDLNNVSALDNGREHSPIRTQAHRSVLGVVKTEKLGSTLLLGIVHILECRHLSSARWLSIRLRKFHLAVLSRRITLQGRTVRHHSTTCSSPLILIQSYEHDG